MKLLWTLLLTCCLATSTLAIFQRTDCSCNCADGTACIKAVPNFLELKFNGCQCEDGKCPSGSEFNGKVPCGSSWEISSVFRCLFYPCDYADNPIYNKNKDNVIAL